MTKTTVSWMLVATAITIAAVVTYFNLHASTLNVSAFEVRVSEVNIPDLPLCDDQHKKNCLISKPDWNALRAGKLKGDLPASSK